ncbi:MAG: alpha/beta fold hydrolase [Desulfobacteraceae bacterium]|nr:alpha/beta fold hydrolase [Desulfobacteraceae bacterium]
MVTYIKHKIDISAFQKHYPFRSHFHRIGNLRYHYIDEGHGEPLVMVHGNPTWSFYFRKLIKTFKKTHRVIAPDHIGCGLSDKPRDNYDFILQRRVDDFSELLRHLNLKRPVTLVLHDWGGMIGLAWALDNLNKVSRIILTNTSGFFPPGNKDIPWRLKVIRKPNPVMQWLVLRINLFARAALYMAPKKKLPGKIKKGLIAPYNCPGNRLSTLKFVQDIPLNANDPSGYIVNRVEQNLERIGKRPVLILWGGRDFVFDYDYFNQWRKKLPEAETHYFKNAGHYLFEDEPDNTTRLIKEFLHRHP